MLSPLSVVYQYQRKRCSSDESTENHEPHSKVSKIGGNTFEEYVFPSLPDFTPVLERSCSFTKERSLSPFVFECKRQPFHTKIPKIPRHLIDVRHEFDIQPPAERKLSQIFGELKDSTRDPVQALNVRYGTAEDDDPNVIHLKIDAPFAAVNFTLIPVIMTNFIWEIHCARNVESMAPPAWCRFEITQDNLLAMVVEDLFVDRNFYDPQHRAFYSSLKNLREDYLYPLCNVKSGGRNSPLCVRYSDKHHMNEMPYHLLKQQKISDSPGKPQFGKFYVGVLKIRFCGNTTVFLMKPRDMLVNQLEVINVYPDDQQLFLRSVGGRFTRVKKQLKKKPYLRQAPGTYPWLLFEDNMIDPEIPSTLIRYPDTLASVVQQMNQDLDYSEAQREALGSIFCNQAIVVDGPSKSGKSTVCALSAVMLAKARKKVLLLASRWGACDYLNFIVNSIADESTMVLRYKAGDYVNERNFDVGIKLSADESFKRANIVITTVDTATVAIRGLSIYDFDAMIVDDSNNVCACTVFSIIAERCVNFPDAPFSVAAVGNSSDFKVSRHPSFAVTDSGQRLLGLDRTLMGLFLNSYVDHVKLDDFTNSCNEID